jgi:hypothetical protein
VAAAIGMNERSLGMPGRILLLLPLGIGLVFARIDPFTVFFFSSYAAVGALLVVRRPGNVIGWLLIWIAFGFIATTTAPAMDIDALRAGTAPWPEFLTAWAAAWGGYATFGGLVALMILFPSGRLPRGRWRRPAIVLLAVCIVVTFLAAAAPAISFNIGSGTTTVMVPNRLAVLPGLQLWDVIPIDALILLVVVCLGAGAVSMLVRFRHADGIERLQLRWLVAALAFMVLAVVAGLLASLVFGDLGGLEWLPAIFAYPTVPAAIYVAIARYRLYDIDRLISRGVAWAILTGLLVATFAGSILVLQTVLTPLTEGGGTLAVAASTLLAAALFQPLRTRVQRTVDRRFNRARVDAQRTIDEFGRHLRDEVDLTALQQRLASAVQAAVSPSAVALWIRSGPEVDS